MNSRSAATRIIACIREDLAPMGFRKRANVFAKPGPDAIRLVQFQKGLKTTAETLWATINLGIFSLPVAAELGQSDKSPGVPDCHYRQRLGLVMPEGTDRWWEIRSELDIEDAVNEIRFGLRNWGLPLLERLSRADELYNLWKDGRSPGLTEMQRIKYLRLLAIAMRHETEP